jgi:hypothetical protein
MVLRGDEGSEFIEKNPENSSLYDFSGKSRTKGSLPMNCKLTMFSLVKIC